MRTGKYLNENERYVIEIGLASNTSISEIARRLGRARSTIQREIKHGRIKQENDFGYTHVYKADYAQRMARQRQAKKGTGLKIAHDHVTAEVLTNLIRENKWSPASALGYAKRNKLIKTLMCVKTLYNYIHAEVLAISYTELPLPRRRRQAYADVLRHSHRNIQGTSIEERPKSVGTRAEFGHWEGDLIVGPRGTRTVCLTLLERKTRYVVATLLPTRHAAGVVRAIDNLEAMLKDRFSDVFKSITFDNGSEFSDFKSIERSCADASRTRTKVYYAHPYRSGERGSNENANGLLRRAGLRKGKDLGKIPAKVFDRAVRWVNELPRSIFYYAPALEMFEAEIGMQLIL